VSYDAEIGDLVLGEEVSVEGVDVWVVEGGLVFEGVAGVLAGVAEGGAHLLDGNKVGGLQSA
jgi:hypothetical protein